MTVGTTWREEGPGRRTPHYLHVFQRSLDDGIKIPGSFLVFSSTASQTQYFLPTRKVARGGKWEKHQKAQRLEKSSLFSNYSVLNLVEGSPFVT